MFFMYLAARDSYLVEVVSSKYEPALTTALTLTRRLFRRSANVLNAQGQNAFRQRSERVAIIVLRILGGATHDLFVALETGAVRALGMVWLVTDR